MALLLSCWFIIEYVLIRDGFDKWYCLSFFIHPFFLIFCQIFLWAKLLISWIVLHLFHPLRIVLFEILWVLRFLTNHFISLFSSERSINSDCLQVVTNCEVIEICNPIQSVVTYYCYSVPQIPSQPKIRIEDHRRNWFDDEHVNKEELVIHHDTGDFDMDESPSLECSSQSPIIEREAQHDKEDEVIDPFYTERMRWLAGDIDMDKSPSLECGSESLVIEKEVQHEKEDEVTDPFYEKYTERMRWLDLLNYERTCGISTILNKQLGTPTSLESTEPTDFSLPFVTLSKVHRRKLLRSLESDFEKVYVGQTCLCWEALHHQYRQVETLACPSSQRGVFYGNEAGNFQNFQVLLERFMENERAHEGKRFCNYVRGRSSFKSLLQVPKISGYMEEEKEGMKEEGMSAREVLKVIEKSIRAFWVFIHTDNKKSRGTFGGLLWNYPPVEDPKDLKLLADLTKGLQKKELRMNDLQRKKRCWLKRENQIDESQKREILYCTIDMKLVSRVLKMSMISTLQLKWCQDKLNNIEFKEGKVIRAFTGCLFPP